MVPHAVNALCRGSVALFRCLPLVHSSYTKEGAQAQTEYQIKLSVYLVALILRMLLPTLLMFCSSDNPGI
jgi:hypothetical protein